MKFLPAFLVFLLPIVASAPSPDLDSQDKDTEEEFESHFKLPKITDPTELKKREDALKKAETIVEDENDEFLEGKKAWFDELNEDSDLPKDEFEKEKTGDIQPPQYARGLLEPSGEEEEDRRSGPYCYLRSRESGRRVRALLRRLPGLHEDEPRRHAFLLGLRLLGSCQRGQEPEAVR